jgi:hypothetical protein
VAVAGAFSIAFCWGQGVSLLQIYFVRFCEVDTSENWLWGWQCEAVIGFWRGKWLKMDVVSWFVGFRTWRVQ